MSAFIKIDRIDSVGRQESVQDGTSNTLMIGEHVRTSVSHAATSVVPDFVKLSRYRSVRLDVTRSSPRRHTTSISRSSRSRLRRARSIPPYPLSATSRRPLARPQRWR
jgi:hypothetical protein